MRENWLVEGRGGAGRGRTVQCRGEREGSGGTKDVAQPRPPIEKKVEPPSLIVV